MVTTKKQWRNINGIVLANKPEGVSSNGFLQQVRRLFQAKKAGHTGTLDPFATGLLPICFGEATKVSGLLLDSDKRYQATLQLGVLTDSGDKEGEVIQSEPVQRYSIEQLEQVLTSHQGAQSQLPPMHSALKHQGKPLYEYMRQGIEVERKLRQITIHSLSLIDYDAQAGHVQFEVFCSKGTYVRTLGESIAKSLGTIGHLIQLHRTQTGAFDAEAMLSFEALETKMEAALLPLDTPLKHLEAIYLNAQQTDSVLHGGTLNLDKPSTEIVRFYSHEAIFIGVGEWQAEKNRLKPKRLFNL